MIGIKQSETTLRANSLARAIQDRCAEEVQNGNEETSAISDAFSAHRELSQAFELDIHDFSFTEMSR